MLIGIDDTDSKRGMCTTYLGTVLKKALERELNEPIELRLVRRYLKAFLEKAELCLFWQ